MPFGAETFQRVFAEGLTKQLQESGLPEEVYRKRLATLFPAAAKPATLPSAVVEAVSLYDKEEHRTTLKNWLKPENKNAVDEEGRSLLHHATAAGKIGLVRFFIEKKKFPIELEDNRSFTPLIYAVEELCTKKDMKKEQRDKMIACVDLLLQKRAKVVSSNPVFPQTALSIAAQFGDLEVFQLLERHGASLDVKFMGVWSILQLAERSENAETNPVIPYLHSKQSVPQNTM